MRIMHCILYLAKQILSNYFVPRRATMKKLEQKLFTDLKREDDVGLVIRGHLHVENQLIDFISHTLLHPEKCDWEKIGYSGKVELALACGLPDGMRTILEKLGELRNDFANNLDATIDPKWVLNTYNSLSLQLKKDLEKSYKKMDLGRLSQQSTLDTRDLLVLIFLSVRQGVHAVTSSPKSKHIRKLTPPRVTHPSSKRLVTKKYKT